MDAVESFDVAPKEEQPTSAGAKPGTKASRRQQVANSDQNDLQMNICDHGTEIVGPPEKKIRKKERWSEERKATAKAQRDVQEARREANGDIGTEAKKKKRKEKKTKEDNKVRPLSAGERVSGPGNASEAERLRNTLGFKDTLSIGPEGGPKFEFAFDSNNESQTKQEKSDLKQSTCLQLGAPSLACTGNETRSEAIGDQHEERVDGIEGKNFVSKLNPEQAVDGFVPRRIFVGGMPFGYSEEMIREYWEFCGPIETLDMMTFPDTGRFKGIAFITFATEEAYQSALNFDGTDCDGQILKVQKCKVDKKKRSTPQMNTIQSNEDSTTKEDAGMHPNVGTQDAVFKMRKPAQKVQGYNVAYVGNVAFTASPDDIRSLFEPYGATLVRLHTDKDTGKPKGYAHVHFKDEESLDRAIELDGTQLFGRKIKVGFAQPKRT